jgi:hypothetical protein
MVRVAAIQCGHKNRRVDERYREPCQRPANRRNRA